ncbi:hypothetical protein FPV24_00500 [Carnobacterium sp. PL24RED07]|uniref:hypothetical protein n=1 Tax=unclassified Carnobacterium TaxID=257487 RepID=UPI0011EC3F2E|nr:MULTISPECIES: hypothetical protein [unclassified Carnobacterium]KAF3303620.1 hypothetical protein FPV22_00500 [Carnobacterium sp. PL26RED25]KAF3307138.1 hypothetical protein FPV24_00500 [Carnobacterium sp. PL24RED07]
MDTKQIIEELGLTGGHYELTTNRKKTPIVKDTNTGEIVAKCCSKCDTMKLRKGMTKNNRKKDGLDSECLNCRKAYNAIPKVKKRKAEYNAEYNAIPENKKRKAEYNAEYHAIPENKKRHAEYLAEYNAIPENKKRKAESTAEWQRNNPDKVAKRNARRNARKRNLPSEDISSISFEKCVLTGATDNVHIEHMIPLDWGNGGTYPGNVYAMEGTANLSKGNRNPFEWYESHGERFGISFEAWSDLIEELAERNGMDPSEYVRFVNWCYDNPRTLEQVIADNKRYGYVVDSLTLYREAMANMATIEIA